MDRYDDGTISLAELAAPVVVCTREGMVVGGSPAGLSLLEACGAGVPGVPHPLLRQLWERVLDTPPSSPTIWHGSTGRSLGCSRHPLGKAHVLLTMRELSDHQQDLTRRLHKQRLETVGQLMATIAHDIRTPLAALVLEVESAWERRMRLTADGIETMLTSVRTAAERLTTTVDSLLEYSRKGGAELAALSMEALLARIDGLLRPLFRDRDHQLTLSLAPTLPQVRANALLLEQALVNLMVNAAEASGQSSSVQVEVCAFDSEAGDAFYPPGPISVSEGVRIDVLDAGPGIAPALRARIFDPFYTTKPDGTGLGVPMAREAVLASGGDLRLRTDSNDGACFSVWLPSAEVST